MPTISLLGCKPVQEGPNFGLHLVGVLLILGVPEMISVLKQVKLVVESLLVQVFGEENRLLVRNCGIVLSVCKNDRRVSVANRVLREKVLQFGAICDFVDMVNAESALEDCTD